MENNGVIKTCASSGCTEQLGLRRCCDFHGGNFIAMLPNELRNAERQGLSTAHLKIIEADYHGGQRVVCTAKNTATCDGGLKPTDCHWYPVFPSFDEKGIPSRYIRGAKCPLSQKGFETHLLKVEADVLRLIRQNPEIAYFLPRVQMVGYGPSRPIHPALAENEVLRKAASFGNIVLGRAATATALQF
jgi:hypothetical protein